jgi:hypothetical protein
LTLLLDDAFAKTTFIEGAGDPFCRNGYGAPPSVTARKDDAAAAEQADTAQVTVQVFAEVKAPNRRSTSDPRIWYDKK